MLLISGLSFPTHNSQIWEYFHWTGATGFGATWPHSSSQPSKLLLLGIQSICLLSLITACLHWSFEYLPAAHSSVWQQSILVIFCQHIWCCQAEHSTTIKSWLSSFQHTYFQYGITWPFPNLYAYIRSSITHQETSALPHHLTITTTTTQIPLRYVLHHCICTCLDPVHGLPPPNNLTKPGGHQSAPALVCNFN